LEKNLQKTAELEPERNLKAKMLESQKPKLTKYFQTVLLDQNMQEMLKSVLAIFSQSKPNLILSKKVISNF